MMRLATVYLNDKPVIQVSIDDSDRTFTGEIDRLRLVIEPHPDDSNG